jgi:phosphopantetheine adenylyltransferase
MHDLIRNIIKEVLAGEKGVALIAGGFKPPTKGHYELVMGAANHPDVSEVKVFIGNAVRDGITAEMSKAVWDSYPLPDNVSVEVSQTPSPIKSIYDYLKSHPGEKIYFVGGVRDEEDAIDLKKRTQSAINKYPNDEVLAIPG